MAWVRKRPELPSSSPTLGFVNHDIDATLHVYKQEIDGIGSRAVQCMMDLEIKTRLADLSGAQPDTFYKRHRILTAKKSPHDINGQFVRHFGVSILRLSGTSPDDSHQMIWSRFLGDGKRKAREIDVDTLIRLLRFELHPDTFERNPIRRHHKEREYLVTKTSPLGFEYDEVIVKRS